MMTFTPKSENEIKEAGLAPDGDYDFNVLEAADCTSKKGNPMIKVKLGVYHGESVRWHVYDYLLGAMEAKLRHFCDSTGLLAKYESGSLCAEDCKGRSGKVRLIVDQDDEQKYPPKNTVKDYVVRKAKPLNKPNASPAKEPEDDDVPF